MKLYVISKNSLILSSLSDHWFMVWYVNMPVKKTNNSLFFLFFKLPFGPKAGTLFSALSKAPKGNCSELGCVVNLKIFSYNVNNGCVLPHFQNSLVNSSNGFYNAYYMVLFLWQFLLLLLVISVSKPKLKDPVESRKA